MFRALSQWSWHNLPVLAQYSISLQRFSNFFRVYRNGTLGKTGLRRHRENQKWYSMIYQLQIENGIEQLEK